MRSSAEEYSSFVNAGTLAALLGFTLSYTQLLPSVLGLSVPIRLATLESLESLAQTVSLESHQ